MAIWRESDKRIGFSDVLGSLYIPVKSLELLGAIQLSSAAQFIEFTDLDGSEQWFYVLHCMVNGGTMSNYIDIYVNGDTTQADYETVWFEVDSNENTAAHYYSGAHIGYMHYPGQCCVSNILCCKAPDGYFRWIATTQRYRQGDYSVSTGIILTGGASKFSLTSINSIGIIGRESSDSLGTGSRFILYAAKRS